MGELVDLDAVPDWSDEQKEDIRVAFQGCGLHAPWMLCEGRTALIANALRAIAYNKPIDHIPRDVLFAGADELDRIATALAP